MSAVVQPPAGPRWNFDEADWGLFLERVRRQTCLPFLGGGVHYPRCIKPGCSWREKLAEEWARDYCYPLDDTNDLARVARFLAIHYDEYFPKEKIADEIRNFPQPDFTNLLEPHRLLADLNLPIYLTTNYDDMMYQALRYVKRDPKREYCRWKEALRDQPTLFELGEVRINSANPLVYHFHGHIDEPRSLVVTEDDYLDYLANLSADYRNLIPSEIQKALTRSVLMFIGYQLSDWDFKVLFRSLSFFLRRAPIGKVAVLLVPLRDQTQLARVARAVGFLDDYFADYKVKVLWGDCQTFAAELRRRLK